MKLVNESKPNELWVDWRKEFYNSFMPKQLENNDILMYSTDNKGNLVVPDRFLRTLKSKIYKKWQLMIINVILVI